MKRTLGVSLVLIVFGILGYGWYFLYGPVRGLQLPPQASGKAEEANAATPIPEPGPAGNSPSRVPPSVISMEPSEEEIENFPARFTIHDGDEILVVEYTGQFRRNKELLGAISIDIYDIASYVAEPVKGETLELLEGLLVDGKAKIYMIRFLNNLPGRPLMNDVYKDINTEFTDVDLARFQENVDSFCSQFKNGSKRDDLVCVVWLPDGRIYSAYNSIDPVPLLVQDVPFARALWRNWTSPRRGDLRFNLVRRYTDAASP